MPRAIMTGVVAVVVCSAVAAPVAEASLQGRNGVIAFAHHVPRGEDMSTIWTVDPQSGRTRQLTHVSRRCGGDAIWLDEYPSFSPSGRLIAYRHESYCDPRSPTGIYLMRSDGSRRRLIRREGQLEFTDSLAFSPSGRLLAFSDFSDTYVIRLARPGDPPRRLAYARVWRRYAAKVQPSWGSNGRLALTLGRSYEDDVGHIGTVGRNGKGPRLITRSMRDGMPDWSPSADRVVFQREKRRSGSGDLLVAPARGGGHRRPRRLTQTRDAFLPAWSPDGRQIAYVRVPEADKRNVGSLWIMRAADSGRQRLVATRVSARIGLSPSRISWQPRPRRR